MPPNITYHFMDGPGYTEDYVGYDITGPIVAIMAWFFLIYGFIVFFKPLWKKKKPSFDYVADKIQQDIDKYEMDQRGIRSPFCVEKWWSEQPVPNIYYCEHKLRYHFCPECTDKKVYQ